MEGIGTSLCIEGCVVGNNLPETPGGNLLVSAAFSSAESGVGSVARIRRDRRGLRRRVRRRELSIEAPMKADDASN